MWNMKELMGGGRSEENVVNILTLWYLRKLVLVIWISISGIVRYPPTPSSSTHQYKLTPLSRFISTVSTQFISPSDDQSWYMQFKVNFVHLFLFLLCGKRSPFAHQVNSLRVISLYFLKFGFDWFRVTLRKQLVVVKCDWSRDKWRRQLLCVWLFRVAFSKP